MTADPATASVADVRRAIHRKFFTSGPSADPVEVAMSIIGPVMDALHREIARLRDERGVSDATIAFADDAVKRLRTERGQNADVEGSAT